MFLLVIIPLDEDTIQYDIIIEQFALEVKNREKFSEESAKLPLAMRQKCGIMET